MKLEQTDRHVYKVVTDNGDDTGWVARAHPNPGVPAWQVVDPSGVVVWTEHCDPTMLPVARAQVQELALSRALRA